MSTHKHPKAISESTFGGADAVPTDDAPSPPKGFTLQKLGRGVLPATAAVRAAPLAAEEIRESATYSSTFGTFAPQAANLADAMQFAAAWSEKRAHADAWRAYVRQQENLAWRFTLGQLDRLKPTYDVATSVDPTVATQFAKVAQMFAPRSQAAAKAVAVKAAKAEAKAKSEAAKAAPQTPAPKPSQDEATS